MISVVVPLAGGDELFQKHGYPYAKPVIELDGKPLVQHAHDCLKDIPDSRFTFVVRKQEELRFHLRNMLQLLDPKAEVVRADAPTKGAAATVMLAVEHIGESEELLIANGDQLLRFNVARVLEGFRQRKLDAGTVVFDSVHPRWSFVKLDADGYVIEAAEKRPISRLATAGLYWFRRGGDFLDAAKNMIRKDASVNGVFYVCPTFNEMVLAQKKVGVHQVERDDYISLATPQAIEEYEQILLARKQKAER